MIFSSVIYIMALIALFQNKERFLCLAKQFIILVLNKDKGKLHKVFVKRANYTYQFKGFELNSNKRRLRSM